MSSKIKEIEKKVLENVRHRIKHNIRIVVYSISLECATNSASVKKILHKNNLLPSYYKPIKRKFLNVTRGNSVGAISWGNYVIFTELPRYRDKCYRKGLFREKCFKKRLFMKNWGKQRNISIQGLFREFLKKPLNAVKTG